jgi:hypothetical protein
MTTAKKPATMCCVNVGYSNTYLLPIDKGMKLVELLQSAFECEREYGSLHPKYTVGQQPSHISLEIVRPEQLRHPDPKQPAGAAPLLQLEGRR